MKGASETSLQRSGSRRGASRGNMRTPSSDSSLVSDRGPHDGFQPGALASVQEAEGSEESDGDYDEESWDLSLEQYPPINLLEKPFKYFLGTKGKVYPDRLSLQQIFYWFSNARLLDGKLLSPTHLSLAFNALRMPALALPDFEELLELLCAQRLLREEVLRDRLVDPRVLRPPGRRAPSPESEESSEASHSPRPSLLFLDEQEEEEGEYDEEGEEDGSWPLPRGTALSGAERGASQGQSSPRASDRQGTLTSQRGSKRASAEQGEESAPGSKHASGARASSRAGSKTNV